MASTTEGYQSSNNKNAAINGQQWQQQWQHLQPYVHQHSVHWQWLLQQFKLYSRIHNQWLVMATVTWSSKKSTLAYSVIPRLTYFIKQKTHTLMLYHHIYMLSGETMWQYLDVVRVKPGPLIWDWPPDSNLWPGTKKSAMSAFLTTPTGNSKHLTY